MRDARDIFEPVEGEPAFVLSEDSREMLKKLFAPSVHFSYMRSMWKRDGARVTVEHILQLQSLRLHYPAIWADIAEHRRDAEMFWEGLLGTG